MAMWAIQISAIAVAIALLNRCSDQHQQYRDDQDVQGVVTDGADARSGEIAQHRQVRRQDKQCKQPPGHAGHCVKNDSSYRDSGPFEPDCQIEGFHAAPLIRGVSGAASPRCRHWRFPSPPAAPAGWQPSPDRRRCRISGFRLRCRNGGDRRCWCRNRSSTPSTARMRRQSRLGELVKGIVDGGQRHRHAGGDRLLVQFLGRQMAVALGEKQVGQRNALARRPQAGFANPLVHSDIFLPAAQVHLSVQAHSSAPRHAQNGKKMSSAETGPPQHIFCRPNAINSAH